MKKKSKTEQQETKLVAQYPTLHRYMSGITLVSVIVAIVGAAIAGNSVLWITTTACMVTLGCTIINIVIIKILVSIPRASERSGNRGNTLDATIVN